jgi:hypothetical protein
MDWYDPNEKLPMNENKTSIRCLAFCRIDKDLRYWYGVVEVYFSAYVGWRRCETDEMIEIVKWTYWDNLNIKEK